MLDGSEIDVISRPSGSKPGDLGSHQALPEVTPGDAAGSRAAALLECLVQFGPRNAQRRHDAEEHAGGERDDSREGEHAGVDADVVQARQVGGEDLQDPQPPEGDEQADDAAQGGQHDAFRQHLMQQAAAVGAQGGAQRHFALPGRGASQRHVGDVGAGDQHDETDGPEQHPQRRAHVTDDVVEEGHDGDAVALVGAWVFFLQVRRDLVHVAARRVDDYAIVQASDNT